MKVHGVEEIEVIYSCKIVCGMEFLLGIDKNFIENLMENIIEGHQEGEVEDPVIKVDVIERMVRLNTLLLQNWKFTDNNYLAVLNDYNSFKILQVRDLASECVNTTETMFAVVVRIHMNRMIKNLQFIVNRTLIYILNYKISLLRSILIHYSISIYY